MPQKQEPLSERELQAVIAQAQGGDTDAFEVLYKQFFPSIYRYIAFRAPEDVAEDVVADVFVKAWEKLHRYTPLRGVPFAAWLFRIARHMVIDAYRVQHEHAELSDELPDPDSLNRADASIHAQDQLRTVRTAMASLPRRYREVLMLSFIADLSHTEVARTLRLTEGAVRVLKFRALKKLASLLPPEIHDSRS